MRSRLLVIAAVAACAPLSARPARAQTAVDSVYLVRYIDRPTTLPAGAVRLDFWGIGAWQPGSPAAVTAILGGGVGITNVLEIGAQVVPVTLAPGAAAFTNPSAYASYALDVGSVSLEPTLQAVFPLRASDPFFVDAGVPITFVIGTRGNLVLAPTFSLDIRENGSGTSLSLPVTYIQQVNERVNWQLTSGLGLSRFDPRAGLARRREAIDFDDLTIPISAEVMYTVAQRSRRRPLADLALQIQWPQIYTWISEQSGWHADDWSLQLSASWYRIP